MTDLTGEHESAGEDDLAELRAFARRAGPDDVVWESPPDGLWDRIAAQAGIAPDGATVVRPADAVVRSLRSPRPRGAPWLLAAAAAVIVVAVVAGLAISRDGSDDPTVLATTPLERLGDSGDGRAELVDVDGSLQIRIQTTGLDPGDGFLEVWVIDPQVSKLVSLGPLRRDGVYDLPAGLDPAAFPIVDVSVEPIDGDPAHSGDSVLRGELKV
jgi:anti-sigma-K factor RskA